jgi:dTMP kinase
MGKGKLIVLEGIDGSGKGTQLKQITKYFDDSNITYVHEHFPKYGHNIFSETIAKFLRGEFGGIDDVDPYFVANIYAMDRYLYLPTLLKQLEENEVVLLDRYVFSNMAFQGAKFKLDGQSLDIKKWISDFEFKFLKLPYPDLTIFLDVPIDVIWERLARKREGDDRKYLKGKEDIHEADLGFQSRVRDNYLYLKHYTNYKIIPCAEVSGDLGGQHWYVLKPEDLFESYKNYIKDGLL